MTDKDRLKNAKLMAETLRVETRLPHDFPFDLVDWLVEQAEQKQSLETAVDFYQSALRDADRRVQELEEDKIVKLTKGEAEWLENYRDSEGYVYDLMHDLPIKYSINHDDLDLDRNMNNMLKLLTAFVRGYELEDEKSDKNNS